MPLLPLSKRIQYAVLWFLWTRLLNLSQYYNNLKALFVPPAIKPADLVKRYPARPSLSVRIFYPPSYTPPPHASHSTTTRLPTILTIHGGGFILGTSTTNETYNRTLSTTHSLLTIALDYRKAPLHPFPTATHDLAFLIHALLSDASLPIDPARVALVGWSAGANLALSVAQLPAMQGRIRAVVPCYPVVDYTVPNTVKALGRQYKPSLPGHYRSRPLGGDMLTSLMPLFDWAYVTPGQRCDDPLLSPYYADREMLPKDVFLVACELDMLAAEAWRMACRWAGRRVPGREEKVGRMEVVGGPGKKGEGVLVGEEDEKYAWEEVKEEDGSRVRWLLVPDTVHGFDQEEIEQVVTGDEEFAADARVKRGKVMGIMAEWLKESFARVEE
ncbi:Alpha/Beta hydrolase protein [Dichotomopilus funicola]|uniref:Alpha/Beta hydrolase protein n=1 Tax=Dichotomopilus funicola TaxID=1934379 RepID=A0AAN6ZL76_9PEZI|nr:Alpha/Beta hydrolase protein [Dichotomopilus funicola]